MIALTSDRGLCGGVHSSVSKKIKAHMEKEADLSKVKIITIGDKAKAMLSRYALDGTACLPITTDVFMH